MSVPGVHLLLAFIPRKGLSLLPSVRFLGRGMCSSPHARLYADLRLFVGSIFLILDWSVRSPHLP